MGAWDRIYSLPGTEIPTPYGRTETYEIGAEWLADCSMVEDWGCGKGWLKTLVPPERYRGIDGSCSPHAVKIADLAGYRSSVPGVFLRHVLEHDLRWRQILANAVGSFTERLVVIVFTPLVDHTHDLGWRSDPQVPTLAFALADLTSAFDGLEWAMHEVGTETVFLVAR